MRGRRYYAVHLSDQVDAFFIDTESIKDDRGEPQRQWLAEALARSHARVKIAVYHVPIYGDTGEGRASGDLRDRLEPMFIEGGIECSSGSRAISTSTRGWPRSTASTASRSARADTRIRATSRSRETLSQAMTRTSAACCGRSAATPPASRLWPAMAPSWTPGKSRFHDLRSVGLDHRPHCRTLGHPHRGDGASPRSADGARPREHRVHGPPMLSRWFSRPWASTSRR